MTNRTKINLLIRLITLTTGLVIGGGVSASVIEVNAKTSPVIGHAPVVNDVTFDKTTPAVNDTVTAIPNITDADNDIPNKTLYQWQLDGKDISGASQNSYTLTSGQGNGKKLTVKVTPQTDPAITEPVSGTAFTSSTITTQGFAPEALNVKIEGTPKPGQLLTGHYNYNDKDSPSDPEDTSSTRVEWICSRYGGEEKLAQTQTYTIQDVDMGCDISFNITPHALSGTPRIGTPVQSNVVNVPKTTSSLIVRVSNGIQPAEFNVEIDYGHLGYGPVESIAIYEQIDGDSAQRAHNYHIGDTTKTGSTVTTDGRTIKFSTLTKAMEWKSKPYTGQTAYFDVGLDFINGTNTHIMAPGLILR